MARRGRRRTASATHADMLTTSAAVDQLQDAASVARRGASELQAARSQVRYAVEDARSAGFQVGEDLSVTDRMVGGSAAQRAARQAAAEAFAGQIDGRAAQLVSVDAQVAGRITAAVAGIGALFPRHRLPTATSTQLTTARSSRAPTSRHRRRKGPTLLIFERSSKSCRKGRTTTSERFEPRRICRILKNG